MKQSITIRHCATFAKNNELLKGGFLDSLPVVYGFPLNADIAISSSDKVNFPENVAWLCIGGSIVGSPELVLDSVNGALDSAYLVFEELRIVQLGAVLIDPPTSKFAIPVYSNDLLASGAESPDGMPCWIISFMVGGIQASAHFTPVAKSSINSSVYYAFSGLYVGGVRVTPKTLADKTCPLAESIKKHLETESQKKFELPTTPLLKTLSERPCTLEELQAAVVHLATLVNKQATELNKKQSKPWQASI